MDPWLLAAAASAAATALLHVFAGGPSAARPLLEAKDIARTPQLTNYYCWHMVSIMLAAMSACFVLAAREPSAWELAALATALAAAFAVWSLLLAFWKRHSAWELPQWSLFLIIAAFGIAGLAA